MSIAWDPSTPGWPFDAPPGSEDDPDRGAPPPDPSEYEEEPW